MIPIFEMAFNADFAKRKIKEKSERVNINVLKCTIYKTDKNNRSHWVGRIADWIDYANCIYVKPRNKLSEKFYSDEFFGVFGNEKSDAISNIKEFQNDNRDNIESNKKSYDDFEITQEMINDTFAIYNLLKDKYSKILADKRNRYNRDNIYDMLMEDFKDILGQ